MTSRDELAELRESIVVAVAFSSCETYGGVCLDCRRDGACFREAEEAVALVEADVLRRVRASIEALDVRQWEPDSALIRRADVLAAVDAVGETPDA